VKAIEFDLGGRRFGTVTRMDVENTAGELIDTRIIIATRWQDEPWLGSHGVAFSIEHLAALVAALTELTTEARSRP
jgi:hypothetical protein